MAKDDRATASHQSTPCSSRHMTPVDGLIKVPRLRAQGRWPDKAAETRAARRRQKLQLVSALGDELLDVKEDSWADLDDDWDAIFHGNDE